MTAPTALGTAFYLMDEATTTDIADALIAAGLAADYTTERALDDMTVTFTGYNGATATLEEDWVYENGMRAYGIYTVNGEAVDLWNTPAIARAITAALA